MPFTFLLCERLVYVNEMYFSVNNEIELFNQTHL